MVFATFKVVTQLIMSFDLKHSMLLISLKQADATLEMEQRDFIRAGLEYVCLIQEVQERKKFEFVETLLAFMYGWLTFYHQGNLLPNITSPSSYWVILSFILNEEYTVTSL